jgi:hypothetical protein
MYLLDPDQETPPRQNSGIHRRELMTIERGITPMIVSISDKNIELYAN